MLHTMMLNLVDRDWASREFLTGQSYLFTGEIDKAIDCFVSASSGINTGLCHMTSSRAVERAGLMGLSPTYV